MHMHAYAHQDAHAFLVWCLFVDGHIKQWSHLRRQFRRCCRHSYVSSASSHGGGSRRRGETRRSRWDERLRAHRPADHHSSSRTPHDFIVSPVSGEKGLPFCGRGKRDEETRALLKGARSAYWTLGTGACDMLHECRNYPLSAPGVGNQSTSAISHDFSLVVERPRTSNTHNNESQNRAEFEQLLDDAGFWLAAQHGVEERCRGCAVAHAAAAVGYLTFWAGALIRCACCCERVKHPLRAQASSSGGGNPNPF